MPKASMARRQRRRGGEAWGGGHVPLSTGGEIWGGSHAPPQEIFGNLFLIMVRFGAFYTL